MNLFEVYKLWDIEPVRGLDTTLWDKEGTEYTDLYGGHAVISVGHCHPHYVKMLQDQLGKLGFYSNAVQNSLQRDLAARLGRTSGYDDYSLFLCNSGAEANENALKTASFHTGKAKVLAFRKAFHGRTSGAVSATDNPKIQSAFNATDNIVFAPLNDLETVERELSKGDFAAVIIEGIQGVAGIYEPTYGKITINGKVAPLLELGAGFDKNYTGKNNIYLNGAFLSMDEKFINSKYDEIIEFSELGEYINYPVKNYSSGMRAKLGFSIATLVEPDILIIDEILSVGDIKFRKKSSEKIRSMMQDGVTVLLVSHSIGQIRDICDKCIWIEDGHLIMEGEANEVCDAYIKSAESSQK